MSSHRDRLGDDSDNGTSRVPRVFRSNLFRALLCFLAALALVVVYGRLRLYRDPVGIFFSEQHGYDRFYSAHREHEAVSFGSRFSSDNSPDPLSNPPPKAGSSPQICASFVTVNRRGLDKQYLETSLASLVANLTVRERETIHIKVFFADPNPALHPQYGSTVVQALADDTVSYRTDFPIEDLNRATSLAAHIPDRPAIEQKSILDYARAIEHCVSTTQARHVAIFEDDVLFSDGWLARTLHALRETDRLMADPARADPQPGAVDPGVPNSWLYLRLFNQERSTGWAGGAGFLTNNVPRISAAVAAPLLLILLGVRRVLRRSAFGRALDAPVLAFVALVVVPTCVWLFFAAGKASLLPPPPGVREEFFGCCSQALVYNRAHAAEMAAWMVGQSERQAGGRGDMLSKQFAWERGLARLSAYPMVVQHVGQTSVSLTTSSEAQKIWSMAFEDLDPRTLRRDHERMVAELWPDEEAVYIG